MKGGGKRRWSSSGLREGRFVCNMRELQPKGEKQTLMRVRVVRQQQLQQLVYGTVQNAAQIEDGVRQAMIKHIGPH